jgi:hypothetical protein
MLPSGLGGDLASQMQQQQVSSGLAVLGKAGAWGSPAAASFLDLTHKLRGFPHTGTVAVPCFTRWVQGGSAKPVLDSSTSLTANGVPGCECRDCIPRDATANGKPGSFDLQGRQRHCKQ